MWFLTLSGLLLTTLLDILAFSINTDINQQVSESVKSQKPKKLGFLWLLHFFLYGFESIKIYFCVLTENMPIRISTSKKCSPNNEIQKILFTEFIASYLV